MLALGLAAVLASAAALMPANPSLSEELWFMNANAANKSLYDPFVLSLGAGTLPRASFAAYVAQDAAFLEAFADAYAKGAEKCAREGALRKRCEDDLGALRTAVMDELQLHAGYAAKWGADLGKGFKPMAATVDYIDFLKGVAADPAASAAEVLAAMAPCMALYAELGRTLEAVGGGAASNPYGEWVRTYASADFWGARERLDALLDALATAATEARDGTKLRRVFPNYARAMELEFAFFHAQSVSKTADADVADFVARLRRGPTDEL